MFRLSFYTLLLSFILQLCGALESLQLYRMDFQLAAVVRKMVLTKQVCLCHSTIQPVLGRSFRHVHRPPGKALYFPWRSLTVELWLKQARDKAATHHVTPLQSL